MSVYDSIGQSYSNSRIPDPRIVKQILNLLQLKPGSTIADIGAGTGGYSKSLANCGYQIYAIEPSLVMRSQSQPHAQVQWFTGCAEDIPLPTASVDAAISVLATHHFSNLEQAFREMHRITRKGAIVIFTIDPRFANKFWFADYFPSLWQDTFRFFPPLSNISELIGATTQRSVEVSTLMLPPNLSDLFVAALWRRPEMYLSSVVRAGMSAFALAEPSVVELGVRQLAEDLTSGQWQAKYGDIKNLTEFDAGYRFLRAKSDR
ncbi:class I SAM-dependent methyltransferase [Aliterella atlantica]|uniref:MerR family transcriptional regulator n=1 Tax=Aliterella atlantica CENA595 TaxID=1618023 RepID=A0A0D8ZQE3_9CYAN|nr:methyltransferase domain-containing protein [Aliterella atlantica]KJH71038.1 MerR family transcriptional regulator [Aliterella atlantica CENA595]